MEQSSPPPPRPLDDGAAQARARAGGLVTVTYLGRLGNNLTQYCIGRILAEGLGFNLQTKPIPGFPAAGPIGEPPFTSIEPPQHLAGHRFDIGAVLADKTPRHIVLDGYFQRYEYLKPYKQLIRETWLAGGAGPSGAPDDLTIHIRCGDIWVTSTRSTVHGMYRALPFSFYDGIVRSRPWSKVTVVTDDPRDAMVQKLASEFGADVRSGSALDDFNCLRASSNVVLSVSSYAWWAAWLSCARRIFFPEAGLFDAARTRARSTPWQIDLWVDDEPRYVAVRPAGADQPWSGTEDDRQRLLNS